MEQAVVSYAEGVAKALVGKLGLLLSEEYKLLRGVRGEVIFLRDDVAIMNSLLRMLAEADDGTVNHFVREWMKQVRELAYDAEDNIDLFARRISCIAPVTWRLGGVWRLWVTLHARHRLGCDIKDLRARALAISERRTRYGIDSQAMRPSAFFAPCNSSLAIVSGGGEANSPAANRLVGIEDQVKSLVKKVNHADNDKQLKVFSIVGFGGLGKTTLAMEVCRRLEDKFHCQATVSISQAFDASKDMGELLKSMLQQVLKIKRGQKHKGTQDEELEHVDNLGVKNESELKEALKTHLKDKRYLLPNSNVSPFVFYFHFILSIL